MADAVTSIINIQQPTDELTLQYIGAATVLRWKDLPANTQDALLKQMGLIGGLRRTVQIEEQVEVMLRRHKQI